MDGTSTALEVGIALHLIRGELRPTVAVEEISGLDKKPLVIYGRILRLRIPFSDVRDPSAEILPPWPTSAYP